MNYALVKDESEEDVSGKPTRAVVPPVPLFQVVKDWVRQNFGGKNQDSTLKEMLEEVLEDHPEASDALAPEERIMLRNMLEFGEITVHDIMVPRTDIEAVEYSITLEELTKHIIEYAHTRIPVYEETLDQIKGFLHVKDLIPMLSGAQPYRIADVMRQILFVPPSMRIVDLLLKMRVSGVHMAIVVDEYGGTDGLVTLEDLFEEIVGEIQDEHDEGEEEPSLTFVSDNVIEADARVRIERLEEETGLNLMPEEEEEEYDTLGGLVFFLLGRVPARGEIVTHPSGAKFEILDADPRRIRKVRIVKNGGERGGE